MSAPGDGRLGVGPAASPPGRGRGAPGTRDRIKGRAVGLGRQVSRLTGGNVLGVALDPKTLAPSGAMADGVANPSDMARFSRGTREQVALTCRLQIGRLLGRESRHMLLLDDPLAHTDPARHREALERAGGPVEDAPGDRLHLPPRPLRPPDRRAPGEPDRHPRQALRNPRCPPFRVALVACPPVVLDSNRRHWWASHQCHPKGYIPPLKPPGSAPAAGSSSSDTPRRGRSRRRGRPARRRGGRARSRRGSPPTAPACVRR